MNTSLPEQKYTIVVVEDDEGLNCLIRKTLHRETDFLTQSFFRGADALTGIAKNAEIKTVLLLDYQLADMTAKEVITLLMQQEMLVPFIITTGHGDEMIAVEMMKLGARDYLVKNNSFLDLLPQIVTRVCRELENEQKLAAAETALRRNEEKMRLALNAAQMGIWEWNILTNEIFWSEELEILMGFPRQASSTRAFRTFLDCVHPDDRKMVIDVITHTLEHARKEKTFYIEHRIIDAQQSILWMEQKGMLFCDAHQQPIRMMGTAQDITERKRAEMELVHHRQHLAQLVEARTCELRQANTELARASRLKDEFLANMSHELRTPLNAILGYAQILKSADNLTPHQHESLKTIKHSGEHLLHLINDILDLSKIEAGQIQLQYTNFYFWGFLRHIAKIIHIRAEQKGLEFDAQYDQRLPAGICADEKRLREILINLLDNAVKFTQQGRVTFRVLPLSSPPMHHLNAIQPDQSLVTLRFVIKDTGMGIAAEDVNDIFTPFLQVGDHRHSSEGTGLGLAISRKLVEIMGGDLNVHSVPNEGSIFWFELTVPDIPGMEEEDFQTKRRIIGYHGERRIALVADDNMENRIVLADRLTLLGFEVLEAENGQQCIDSALEHHPDIILMDLWMPVLDGLKASRRIREIDALTDVVLIAVSASVDDATQQKSLEAGYDDFLAKPFQFETLTDLLKKHLQLEWLYQEEPPKLLPDSPQESSSPLLPLPDEDREHLCHLAELGIAKELMVSLDRLEHEQPQFLATVSALRWFVKQYQFEELIHCLQEMG